VTSPPTPRFRNRPAYDGSFAGPGQGFLPCPPGVSYCLRISSLPANEMLGPLLTHLVTGDRADRIRAAKVAANTLLKTNLTEAIAEIRRAYAQDPDSAREEPKQLRELFAQLRRLKTPDEGGADIFPGRRHPLPVSNIFWMTFMMSPGVSGGVWRWGAGGRVAGRV
jgi:hypothetical protein